MKVFRPPSPEERDEARTALDLSTDGLVTVYIGRLVDWKRVDLLLEAWSRLDETDRGRLLIVGDGPEGERLRAMGSGLRGVRFEGISRRPVAYLRAADIFANASGVPGQQAEGLSVSLLEAMAVGLPAVVTSGPGNDVVIEDGVTGLQFPESDVDALEDRLRRLLDGELRRRLGQAAHERVRKRYSITAVAAQVQSMYRGS